MKKIYLIIFITVVIFFTVISRTNDTSDELILGVVPTISELPVFVAYEKGYFAEQGLDVKLEYSTSGKMSLDKIISGAIDIGACSQTPIMYESFTNDEFKIIASLYKSSEIVGILVRKSADITSPKDFVGKKIGLLKGTSSDFHLNTYLIHYGIDPDTVELVNLNPNEHKSAIVEGRVDVIFTWQPYIFEIESEMGDKIIRFDNENLNTMTWLALANNNYIESNADIIEKYYRAIIKSEKYIVANVEDSIASFSELTNSDYEMNMKLFELGTYKLGLTEEMLIILEDQAQWAIRTNKVDKEIAPNYLERIYFDGLKNVDPNSVNLIFE